jgi:hypothetical protein
VVSLAHETLAQPPVQSHLQANTRLSITRLCQYARSVRLDGQRRVCDRAAGMHAQPGPGTMRAVSGHQDLPGYSSTQETEALGLLAVQTYLVRHGFKVTEVTGRFDDGLDLLVSSHDEANVLPAIAGIQGPLEAVPPRAQGWSARTVLARAQPAGVRRRADRTGSRAPTRRLV